MDKPSDQLLTDHTRTCARNKGGQDEKTKTAGAESESGVQGNLEEYE